MPLKFNEATGQFDVVGKRGRKPGSGARDAAQNALTGEPKDSKRGFQKIVPAEGSLVHEYFAAGLQNLLHGFGLDSVTERELTRRGIDPAKVAENPSLYSSTIAHLIDELSSAQADQSEEIADLGIGTVGEHTIKNAGGGESRKDGSKKPRFGIAD